MAWTAWALTELEPGAEATLLYPSGVAAVTTALLTVLSPGDHVLCAVTGERIALDVRPRARTRALSFEELVNVYRAAGAHGRHHWIPGWPATPQHHRPA